MILFLFITVVYALDTNCSISATLEDCLTNCNCIWCHNTSTCMFYRMREHCYGTYTLDCQDSLNGWLVLLVVILSIIGMLAVILGPKCYERYIAKPVSINV